MHRLPLCRVPEQKQGLQLQKIKKLYPPQDINRKRMGKMPIRFLLFFHLLADKGGGDGAELSVALGGFVLSV